MIYLLPVNHAIQFGRDYKYPFLLEYIEKCIKEKGITLICEEASQQDIESRLNRACVKEVAEHYKIPHLLCDPSDDERKKAGIYTSMQKYERIKQHKILMCQLAKCGQGQRMKEKQDKLELEMQVEDRKREKIWYERIAVVISEEILFVLGAGHISTHRSSGGDGFDKLLQKEGLQYEVLGNKEFY